MFMVLVGPFRIWKDHHAQDGQPSLGADRWKYLWMGNGSGYDEQDYVSV